MISRLTQEARTFVDLSNTHSDQAFAGNAGVLRYQFGLTDLASSQVCCGPLKTASSHFARSHPNTFKSFVAVIVLRAGDLNELVLQVLAVTSQHLRDPVLGPQVAPAQEATGGSGGEEDRCLQPPPPWLLLASALLGTTEGAQRQSHARQRRAPEPVRSGLKPLPDAGETRSRAGTPTDPSFGVRAHIFTSTRSTHSSFTPGGYGPPSHRSSRRNRRPCRRPAPLSRRARAPPPPARGASR